MPPAVNAEEVDTATLLGVAMAALAVGVALMREGSIDVGVVPLLLIAKGVDVNAAGCGDLPFEETSAMIGIGAICSGRVGLDILWYATLRFVRR